MKLTVNTKITWTGMAIAAVMTLLAGYSCSSGKKTAGEEPFQIIQTNAGGRGIDITLRFTRGPEHNHPLMAIWLEDTSGRYIETLYVAESIGKGIFQHGDKSKGMWQAGEIRRPAALPYWGHKRGIQAEDGYYLPTTGDPMPDAVTGATPGGNFIMESKASAALPEVFMVMMEINQPWDWNDYWTNSKYPDDPEYKTSCQPAVVYAVRIAPGSGEATFPMKAIGHSHYSGKDGSLTTDLSTLSTALDIVGSAEVTIAGK